MSANPSRKLLRRRLLAEGRLTRKPVGMWGWRIEHGARTTRTTSHGGRAHTVYSFQYRRASIAAARNRL